jgi:hypothetical protein
MKRREFIVLLGGATAWPLAVRARQHEAKYYRIAYLALLPGEDTTLMKPLLERLNELGYVEGKNMIFEYRSAEDHPERLPQSDDNRRQGRQQADGITGHHRRGNVRYGEHHYSFYGTSTSLQLDAGCAEHFGPLLGRFDNKCGELSLCANKGKVTQLKGPRGELRISNASVNFAMESFYDFNRGVSRSANALPSGSLIAWYELSDGRHVRQHWRAGGGRYAQRAQFIRLDVFYRRCQGIEHDRDFAGENAIAE